MNYSSCLHPKRIYNKYLREFVYVPCGHCAACLNQKASNWTRRLEFESKCWKYNVFVTLTYAPEHLPVLVNRCGNFVPKDIKHLHPDKDIPSFSLQELSEVLYNQPDRFASEVRWLSANTEVPFLSVYDLQCFIKRLRKNCYNYCKKTFKDYESKDFFIRYYAVGEFGSTTLRPHYHLIFGFNSEKQASYFEKIVCKSWQFGIVDFSFIKNSAASYVASYVNSTSRLPFIYQYCKQIGPFSIFSKQPPIGTLFFASEETRKMFDSCSPLFVLPDFKQGTFMDVPLWQTYKDRLFPQLSFYSKVSSRDRVKLYGIYDKYCKYSLQPESGHFVDLLIYHFRSKSFNSFYTHLFHDYLVQLHNSVDNEDSFRRSIMRWYFISNRVCYQSVIFGVSVDVYCEHIDRFYTNLDVLKLKNQYRFLSESVDVYNGHPIGFYREFWDLCNNTELDQLSADEIMTLESFGIDLDKFYNDDLSVRNEYRGELEPFSQNEFITHLIDSELIAKQRVKTKFKNDYLDSIGYDKSKLFNP